ncbi:membrane protein of unknown function (plasmid) [Paraburkholderia kururiensis]
MFQNIKAEWEACWAGVSLIAMLLAVFAPVLNSNHFWALVAGTCAMLCGYLIGLLYLFSVGVGRHWLGSFLPFALGSWGLWLLLHLPPSA